MRADDIGAYMCYATNEVGSDQDVVNIDIEFIQNGDPGSSSRNDKKKALSQEQMEQIYQRLDQESQAFEAFQNKINLDISALRNLTFDSLIAFEDQGSASGSRVSSALDKSVFSDLERIQLEIGRMQSSYNDEVGQLLQFRTKAKDDLNLLWDNVTELNEVTNVTMRHVSDIYDKDILKLQNFQTATETALNKLRSDFEAVSSGSLKSVGGESSYSEQSQGLPTNEELGNRLISAENELAQISHQFAGLSESNRIYREEMGRAFKDIDELKKAKRLAAQEREMMARKITWLEEDGMADINLKFEEIGRKFEANQHFQEQAEEKLNKAATYDEEKFILLIQEMQKLKSQIYYLQQSVLHLRSSALAEGGSTGNGNGNGEPTVAPSNNNQVAEIAGNAEYEARMSAELRSLRNEMSNNMEKCLPRTDFDRFLEDVVAKEESIRVDLEEQKEDIAMAEKVARSAKNEVTESGDKIRQLEKQIDKMESDAKKYNLLVDGLRPIQKLERPKHVELLVQGFLRDTLQLEDIEFDEASRLGDSAHNPKTIVVRFPNVRVKTRVMGAARTALRGHKDGLRVSEDFTARVHLHRQRLVAFARRRAKATKKKWALKYDQLYFNGKVFVYNDKTKRVVPFSRST